MLGRRGLLKLLAGGAGAAASGISVKDMAKAAGLSVPPTPDVFPTDGDEGDPGAWSAVGRSQIGRDLSLAFEKAWTDMREGSENDRRGLPVRIASKKSWSPAFKAHCARQEEEELHRLRELAEKDAEFRARLRAMILGS